MGAVLATTAPAAVTEWFWTIAVVVIVVAVLVSPFRRRIGGEGGGSETTAFGAWLLLGVILLGFVIATR